MLQTHQLSTLSHFPRLQNSMYRDRRGQFVDRLRWNLKADEFGREIDRYDNVNAKYLIYSDSKGDHLGSLRLTQCSSNCMIKDFFSGEFEDVSEFGASELEITRFCVSPRLNGAETKIVSNQLIRGAFFHAMQCPKVKKIVGVCYRAMLRIYRQSQASPQSIEFGKRDNSLVLTKWAVSAENFLGIISSNTQQN